MQELPRLSRWGICVHSSPSAVRKIISFWKTRKREAEGFDNEALRIRGHCFASGLWVKSQGAEEGVQEAASTIQKTQLPLSDDDTGNHRKCQHTFPKTSISMWCLSFYFLPFYYFFLYFFLHPLLPVLHHQECCIISFGCCEPLAILYCC